MKQGMRLDPETAPEQPMGQQTDTELTWASFSRISLQNQDLEQRTLVLDDSKQ